MKALIRCKCGKVSRWKDMAKGGVQKTVEGPIEIRHCTCNSSHSQFIDASVSKRLKTRRAPRPTPRVLTARSIIKGRLLYMGIPLMFRNRR